MKKMLVLLSAIAVACCMLVSCNDGKCDNCGKDAIENDPKLSGVKGEYCVSCLAEEMGKVAAELIGG